MWTFYISHKSIGNYNNQYILQILIKRYKVLQFHYISSGTCEKLLNLIKYCDG